MKISLYVLGSIADDIHLDCHWLEHGFAEEEDGVLSCVLVDAREQFVRLVPQDVTLDPETGECVAMDTEGRPHTLSFSISTPLTPAYFDTPEGRLRLQQTAAAHDAAVEIEHPR